MAAPNQQQQQNQTKMQQITLTDGADSFTIFVPEAEVARLTTDSNLAASYLRTLRSAKNNQIAGGALPGASSTPISDNNRARVPTNQTSDTETEDPTEKAVWTYSLAHLLIEEYERLLEEFRDPKQKKKELWKKISAELEKKGHKIPWQACDKKWRNMKMTYKAIATNKRKTVRGSSTRWEFFDKMHKICSGDADSSVLSSAEPSSPPSFLDVILSARDEEDSNNCPMMVGDLNNSPLSKKKKRRRSELEAPWWFKDFIKQYKADEEKRTFLVERRRSEDPNCPDGPPTWFKEYIRHQKLVEEARLKELRRLHDEKMLIEKEKCSHLQRIAHAVEAALLAHQTKDSIGIPVSEVAVPVDAVIAAAATSSSVASTSSDVVQVPVECHQTTGVLEAPDPTKGIPMMEDCTVSSVPEAQ